MSLLTGESTPATRSYPSMSRTVVVLAYLLDSSFRSASCFMPKDTAHVSRLSGTTRVSRYQKGNTNLNFTEARDSEWQWHQLGHMQVCTSLQTDKTPAPHHSGFTRLMPFLPPNQQRQSTEGSRKKTGANLAHHRTEGTHTCDWIARYMSW